MRRPRPTISSANEYAAYFEKAQEFAERFAACDGVVGVLLTGGVARGYADHFSELDLAVYLTRPHFEDWTRRGLAPFPEGDSCLDGWHVDFDYFCYEDEIEAEWEHTKRWDRSYAVVLHDPQGLMQEMLARKAVLTDEEKQRLTTHHLILYGEYFCNLVVPSWLHRGDLLAAHHCLNTALDSLIRAVFLANDELIPFDKWTLNLSYTLPWTPQDWRERVEEAILVREVSQAEVERRCALIRDLFAECRDKLVGPKTGGLDIIEARKLEILRIVRERGAMPAAEFDQCFGLRRAIQSPLFHLLRREMRDGEEWLVFDEEQLWEYAARNFTGFLEWDWALLRALTQGEFSSRRHEATMSDVTIRQYRTSDLDRCQALWIELTQRHRDIYNDPSIGGDTPGFYFDKHLARVGPERLWVAEHEGEVVGLVGLIVDEQGAEVEPVVVAAAHRGKGIGRALLNRMVEEARKLGVRYLSVKPVARNVEAISFYYDFGFQTLGEIEMFIDLGTPAPGSWKPGPELFGHSFEY